MQPTDSSTAAAAPTSHFPSSPAAAAVAPAQISPADYLIALREKLTKQLDRFAHGVAADLVHRGVTSDVQRFAGEYRATEYAIRLVDELLDGPERQPSAVSLFYDRPELTPARPAFGMSTEFAATLQQVYGDWIKGKPWVDPIKEGRSHSRAASAPRRPSKAAGSRGRSGARK